MRSLLLLSLWTLFAAAQVPVTTQNGSLVAALASIPGCSSFTTLLTASKQNTFMIGIYPNLTFSKGDNNPPAHYTILAYTNAASDALAGQNSPASALLSTPNNQAALLTYHIIPNLVIDFSAGTPPAPFVATSLSRYGNGFDNLGFGNNQNIGVKQFSNGTGYFTTGMVQGIVQQSIKTDYGIIHVISSVMIIPTDILSLTNTLALTDYSGWLKSTNLTSGIKSIQGTTVLIPAQGGIPRFLEAMNGGADINTALKQSILQYQMIAGVYYSNQLSSSAAGDWAINTAQGTYFNGQKIYVQDSTHFATTTSPTAPKLTIQTPDILFDSGVIHIVDTVLLPPTISNAQTTPVPSPLAQIYPAGLDPNEPPPLGNDIPVGAIVGGVAAGVAVLAMGACLWVVVRRRRLIAKLEHEKYARQMEMKEYLDNEEGGGESGEEFDEEEEEEEVEGSAGVPAVVAVKSVPVAAAASPPPVYNPATSSVLVSPSAAAVAGIAAGSTTSVATPSGYTHQVPLRAVDEEDDDDEEEEEEETDEQALQASYDQIMQYRRAQWSADDPKRKSIVSQGSGTGSAGKRASVALDTKQKRVSGVPSDKRKSTNVSTEDLESAASTVSSIKSHTNLVPPPNKRQSTTSFNASKRQSTASFNAAKRMSTASSNNGWGDAHHIVISDAKEAKKEAVRNSWWSATGVGGNTHDAAVLEAQALREEERKSWWSGSNEVQEALHAAEASKRSSFAIPLGDRRKSAASSMEHGRRRSNGGLSVYSQALESGEQGELEYVHPSKSLDPRKGSTGGERRKSWKPTKASGLVDGASVPAAGMKQKRRSGGSAVEYTAALAAGGAPLPSVTVTEEEDSALAFVVGKN
ncbi:hypothetical protein HDU98_003178 [Podochytrium sp. JEL0797]|nr:hypothetical protein HDU98_003178 [Podochytrium sp. JEL0797]